MIRHENNAEALRRFMEQVTKISQAQGKADGLRRAADIVTGYAQTAVYQSVARMLVELAQQLIRESEEAADIVRVEVLPIPGKSVN